VSQLNQPINQSSVSIFSGKLKMAKCDTKMAVMIGTPLQKWPCDCTLCEGRRGRVSSL